MMIKRGKTGQSVAIDPVLKEAASEHQRFLVPRAGLTVRDPSTKIPLAPQGEWKPWVGVDGRYWRRRVGCGDASLGEIAPQERFDSVVEQSGEAEKL
jgi:hypothetical protein